MNWFIKRIGQGLFTIFAVASLTFVLIRTMPGSPAQQLAADIRQNQPSLSARQINVMVEQRIGVDPDQPMHEAYMNYMLNLAQGNLGESVNYQEPVADIILRSLPWTAFVMSVSLLFVFIFGIGLGAIMAYREGSKFDVGSSIIAIFLSSVPYYVAAVVMIYVLALELSLFPLSGRYPRGVEPGFTLEFFTGALHHAVLPAASFIVTTWGGFALGMRGNSIQVLGNDYIRVAKLRGLSDRRIALRYVGRNAILPMWTSFLITVGFMFGASIILEEIFTYRGIGYYMFDSIENRDYPVMMGTFLVITVSVVIAVLVADITYGKLDPRVESGGGDESY
ncbi:ABC transporter permease [Halobacteria archaeon AArc-m2/3/4]|uniref:ABC transporter permease n=1 Tax=Natronoglomus mannanivorans TaxID=2979990 RepID=A0AAP2YXH3_9EURY|nr:ABC transporter permease [Halobacteria archaeon AArc-xg1-1]MCU4972560.1 ABC transporter permease [Halobacteria archaeon AArc-m2/3/4]